MTYRMTHGPRPMTPATKSSRSAPMAYKAAPTMSYSTRQSHSAPRAHRPAKTTAVSVLKGVLGVVAPQFRPPTRRIAIPKLTAGFGPSSLRYQGFGQEPPPAGEMNWGMIVGWAAVVATGAGVFWAVTRGGPRAVAANRRRRTSRRSSRRRSSRRRSRRSTRKNLSAAARRRIPKSEFVFPQRRAWPLDSQRRAKAAISYLHMGRVGGRSEYLQIRNAIIRKYGMSFWRDNNGPSWSKVEKAKRKRRRSRKTSRRKVAANRRGSRRKVRWAAYAYTPAGRWIEKSRHKSIKLAEAAAEKLLNTGRYAKVAVDRPRPRR